MSALPTDTGDGAPETRVDSRGRAYRLRAALPTPGTFGALLRQFRLRAGLSQEALGRLSEVDSSYVNRLEVPERGRWEERQSSREVVQALARGLALLSADRDALYAAAGYLPPGLQKLGHDDSTIAAVVTLLCDDRMPPESRADFRAVVEVMAARWGRR